MQYNIDITIEQSFRYMELADAKIWISKNVSLCWVFANRVTINRMLASNNDTIYMYTHQYTCTWL